MIHSSSDVPYRREGESHYAIRQHYDNCDVLLKCYCYNSSNDYLCSHSIQSVGHCELFLVHVTCIQRFVWGEQPAWNDMEQVVNVGQLLSGPDAFTD